MKSCHGDNMGNSRGYYVKYIRDTSEKDKYQGSRSVNLKSKMKQKQTQIQRTVARRVRGWVKIGEEDYEERTFSYAIHKPWEGNNTVITIRG